MIKHTPSIVRSARSDVSGRTFGLIASDSWSPIAQVLLALCLALFLVAPAHAQRTISAGNLNQSFPSMSLPRNKTIGLELPGYVDAGSWSVDAGTACTITKASTVNGTLVPGYTNVYQTSNPGIGVRFGHTQGTFGAWVNAPWSDNIALSASAASFPFYRGFAPVIIGPISTAAFTSFPTMTITFSGPCITTKSVTASIGVGGLITALTCTVLTPSSTVTLPNIPALQLSPVGTTAGNTNFSIGLNCASGGTANVYTTLTDGANPANRTSNLTLGSASTAQGVALRILNGGTPILFGADSAVAGNTNQFLVGAASATSTIPLTAQYISTGPVVPGSVKATATFTMSYQ